MPDRPAPFRLGALRLWAQERVSRLRVQSAERRLHESAVHLACERIVSQVNPTLRGLPGYRRRLFPVAERLLAHGESLIRAIPGPVTLDPASWAADPLVNALFGNLSQLQQVLSGRAVQRWLKEHPATDGELFGLLLAMPQERRQLGMELIGDRVQRDVKQTTLGFTDIEVAAVADGMDALRRSLLQPVVDVMVSIGHARIEAREERIAQLEAAVRMLKLKLKVVNPRVGGVDLVLGSSSAHLAEQARLQGRIDDAERDLADARQGLANIEEYLDCLINELDHPERELHFETMRLWLDRMNIIRDRSTEGAHEIGLVRARRPDRPGRIALYVHFPRRLVQDPDERLADIARQIGG
jgi:hypothetical protein